MVTYKNLETYGEQKTLGERKVQKYCNFKSKARFKAIFSECGPTTEQKLTYSHLVLIMLLHTRLKQRFRTRIGGLASHSHEIKPTELMSETIIVSSLECVAVAGWLSTRK